ASRDAITVEPDSTSSVYPFAHGAASHVNVTAPAGSFDPAAGLRRFDGISHPGCTVRPAGRACGRVVCCATFGSGAGGTGPSGLRSTGAPADSSAVAVRSQPAPDRVHSCTYTVRPSVGSP